ALTITFVSRSAAAATASATPAVPSLSAVRAVGPAGPPVLGPKARAATGHPRMLLAPPMLSWLRERARAGAPVWQRLHATCEDHLRGHVEWPDGNHYPDAGSIGEGYQGDGYYDPLLSLALCYHVERERDPAQAARYARRGVEVLARMSEPAGS